MWLRLAKLAGLAVAVAGCTWALNLPRSDTADVLVVWLGPLLLFPITLLGRRMLNVNPTVERAEWTTVVVHYATMLVLGASVFRAIRIVSQNPGTSFPMPATVGRVLVISTGLCSALTVLTLAIRGLGAPFAIKLSSRLATDWIYRWSRNPMVLSTLSLLLAFGLNYRAVWFLIYVLLAIFPGWVFFVRRYEERELEIRFGPSYLEYRAKTPFFFRLRPHSLPRLAAKRKRSHRTA